VPGKIVEVRSRLATYWQVCACVCTCVCTFVSVLVCVSVCVCAARTHTCVWLECESKVSS